MHMQAGVVMVDELRVLLVEDSHLLSARLLELVAEIDGVTPIGAVTTESEAIESVRKDHPDAVILDLRLKEGTGFGVMRFINTLQMQARPAVIVITNYALPQYRQQAQALGVGYFLDKSQEFDQLPGILDTLRKTRFS
jgi:two-component system, OmpR family, response regulator